MYFFFFFKQKTAYEMRISDWSSDVCSSDLTCPRLQFARSETRACGVGSSRTSAGMQSADAGVRPMALIGVSSVAASGPSGSTDWERADGQIGRASCRERVCQYV